MFAARRASKHPDLSFDLDGDGAVSAADYFIGKQFCVEHDKLRESERREALAVKPEYLSSAERQNAVHALENG